MGFTAKVTKWFVFSISLALLLTAQTALAKSAKVSPESVPGAKTVTTVEAKRLFDQGVAFIDVRSNRDWEAGRIPGAIHLELKKVFSEETLLNVAQKDQSVLIYCNSTGCLRSSKAAQQAAEWGYSRVYYYRLGYPEWKSSGFAIE